MDHRIIVSIELIANSLAKIAEALLHKEQREASEKLAGMSTRHHGGPV